MVFNFLVVTTWSQKDISVMQFYAFFKKKKKFKQEQHLPVIPL